MLNLQVWAFQLHSGCNHNLVLVKFGGLGGPQSMDININFFFNIHRHSRNRPLAQVALGASAPWSFTWLTLLTAVWTKQTQTLRSTEIKVLYFWITTVRSESRTAFPSQKSPMPIKWSNNMIFIMSITTCTACGLPPFSKALSGYSEMTSYRLNCIC